MNWRRALGVYLLIYIGHRIFFHFLKSNTIGYDHLHILRFAQIVDMNFMMGLGTIFLWARLKSFFLPSCNDNVQQLINNANYNRKVYTFQLAYLVFASCVHFSNFSYYFYDGPTKSYFAYICLLLFGFWIHAVFILIGFSFFNFFVRLVQASKFGREVLKPLFKITCLKNIFTEAKSQTLTAISLSLLLCSIQLYGALTLYTKNVEIKIDNLPEKFNNFRIALLSDLHASPTIDRSEFWSIVNKTNALDPDIVIIAGDLIDGSLESLKDSVLPVKYFQSKFGVFFATGNHEYYYGKIDDWFPYLKNDLNVNVLHNSNHKIKKSPDDETYLCLAGVDDIYSESFKLKGHSLNATKALNGCGDTFPRILISHNPKGARLAVMQESSIDLILSGHVHAGQMYVTAPFMYMAMPYFYGLYRHENGRTQIYVTSGCYFWAAPLKMPGFSQITLITLIYS